MTLKTDNLNIQSTQRLISPAELRAAVPLTEAAADTTVAGRAAIENILLRRDDRRLFVIVGPCSIHNREAALEYARRLRDLSADIADRVIPIMRVYFEKPRTSLGWKGLIYDPDLDDSGHIDKGLRQAREILRDIVELGVPAATELLEPIVPQYITDLLSWAAIGARTTESQTHRQMASGLSMPIGFKNATDGQVQTAVEAVRTARSPHTFIGIQEDGHVGLFRTRGNAFGHLVLRGGAQQPNYTSEHIAFTSEVMRKNTIEPNIVVDCSHANSRKLPEKQAQVADNVLLQMAEGQTHIVGLMIESNLLPGNQPLDISSDKPPEPGRSITDACLGWENTEKILRHIHTEMQRMNYGSQTA
ncbi:MAG: 3-deoxy-7-phosphoheptulonate synthase [Verrucomicrobiota bacterium]